MYNIDIDIDIVSVEIHTQHTAYVRTTSVEKV